MSLYDDIIHDLTSAIKGKDTIRLSVLRGLKTAIKNKQVELRQELNEDQIRGVISSEIKKRKEAIVRVKQLVGHPDKEDLEKASTFAKSVLQKVKG